MNPVEARQSEFVRRLRVLPGTQERLSTLADRGRKLPALRDGERTESALVPGCVSRVWLTGEAVNGHMRFRGDCESAMVKGLAALLCAIVEDQLVADVAALPDECPVWADLGLDGELSPTRLRGLANVWRRLRGIASES